MRGRKVGFGGALAMLGLGCLLLFSGCTAAAVASPQREDFTAKWAAIAASQDVGPVTPSPVTPGVCTNCNGKGKVGDGTVMVTCAVCGGDGRVGNEQPGNAAKTLNCANSDCQCANCEGPACPCAVAKAVSEIRPLVESDLSPPIQIVPVALPRRAAACASGACGPGGCAPPAQRPAPAAPPPVVYQQQSYGNCGAGGCGRGFRLFGRRR